MSKFIFFLRDERKEFIRAKYIQHKYAIKSGDNTEKILQVSVLLYLSEFQGWISTCFRPRVVHQHVS